MRVLTLFVLALVVVVHCDQQCQTTGSLNVRSGMGTNYSVLKVLAKGTTVTVYSTSGTWAKISKTDSQYVSTTYLTGCKTIAVPTPTTTTKCVTATSLNVRSGAGTSYSVVKTLKLNDQVTVYSSSNGWAKISSSANQYVSESYLGSCGVTPPTPPPTPTGTKEMCARGSVNIRSGPSTSNSQVGSLSKNTKCTVYETKSGFSRIGTNKWVSSQYLVRTCPKDTKQVTIASLKFNYSAPNTATATKKTLWATSYYSPIFTNKAASGNYALRKPDGSIIAYVTKKEWCKFAMEGSGRIDFKGTTGIRPVTYEGQYDGYTVSCTEFYGNRPGYTDSRAKFNFGTAVYGSGAYLPVVPYRSIAVDSSVIPYGSLVYVPSAVGNLVEVNGKKIAHDGYFIAADCGGGIKQTHIDVFTGDYEYASSFFPWVKSKESGTFTAYIVDNYTIQQELIEFSYGLRI